MKKILSTILSVVMLLMLLVPVTINADDITDSNLCNGEAIDHDFGKSGKAPTCVRCGISNPDYYMPFSDVPSDAYYAEPVAWAVDNGITSGTSETTFSPSDICTKAQVVTLLWRLAGKPEPTITENQLLDVKETDYYYKAVFWAIENNCTGGHSENYFYPDETCRRGRVITIFWQATGYPAPFFNHNAFKDIKDVSFLRAIRWATDIGLTVGTSPDTFSPYDYCTRGQLMTFLFRYAHNREVIYF